MKEPMNSKQIKLKRAKKDIYGIISNIQVYSLHDGPGVRTLVFLKGCNLKCTWCCNPENQTNAIEVEFYQSKCLDCLTCLTVCNRKAINTDLVDDEGFRINKYLCDECGKCVEFCPAGALKYVGEKMSVDEVIHKIQQDKYFYLSTRGGVTLSGGEPLCQFEFTKELLKSSYNENINTAIETCGNAPWNKYDQIIPFLDLILFDIKHMDPKKHEEKTGVTNYCILENLIKISESGIQLIIRIPLIPNFNLDKKNIHETIQFLLKLKNVEEINLMPFHQLGRDKYRRLGRKYSLDGIPPLNSDQSGFHVIEKIKEDFKSYGFKVTVGG
jgi:pyruvate formate lyase activating enzyme